MMTAKPPIKKALLATLLSLTQYAQAEPVSFAEAWQTVVTSSDALAAERANIEYNENLQAAAKDLYLPKVGIATNYVRLGQSIEFNPLTLSGESHARERIGTLLGSLGITEKDLTVQVAERNIIKSSVRAVWPIFTGGRIDAAQNIAKGQTEEARYLLAMKERAKFEDLTKYYFGVVLADQVLQTRVDMESGLKKHLDYAKKMEQQGQIAKVERLQAEASYDKAKVERQKATRDLEIAQAALTKLLKHNSTALPTSRLFVNESLPPMLQFVDKTLMTYPGLQVLDAKQKQATSLIKHEKGKYYPEVYLYGNYNIHEDGSVFNDNSPDWSVGVGVNIPLLDNSGRSGKLKAAHSRVKQVNYLRSQAKQDLSLLVEKTYREGSQALEEYNSLKSSVTLAQENVRLREKAFTQGLSTSLDVVDAETYLASIKTQRFAAAYQYVISLSRLLAISGDIDEFRQYQQYLGLEVNNE